MSIPRQAQTREPKARVEIRDWSLWIKHIQGDRQLAQWLEALGENESVELVVGGMRGRWIKKRDARTGTPTPGLKPVEGMRSTWFHWFKTRRGESVDISLPEDSPPAAAIRAGRSGRPRGTSSAERQAAWNAFIALRTAGWRSEGRRLTREELHERDPAT